MVQSKATTVGAYLASLPADRRAALEAVRAVIRKNLDVGYEEGIQNGMIGYYVPHRLFPAGYHCDPKVALPFAMLASQKGHMSLHLMGLYISPDGKEPPEARDFREAWAKTGRKLDMGKACIRFKKIEDVALDVLGETFRRLPMKLYIERYEAALATRAAGSSKKPAATSGAKKAATKPTAKKKAAKRA